MKQRPTQLIHMTLDKVMTARRTLTSESLKKNRDFLESLESELRSIENVAIIERLELMLEMFEHLMVRHVCAQDEKSGEPEQRKDIKFHTLDDLLNPDKDEKKDEDPEAAA